MRPETSNFNTKADVCSLGCVLFELVTGEKAFNSDWEAQNYSPTFPISVSELPDDMSHISEMLSDIGSIFLSYLTAMDPAITPTVDALQLPSYTRWKELVKGSSNARDLQTNLALH